MKRYQRRNRTGLARERWIMVATSVFVLAALTLIGMYVRDINRKNNDGYVVDFSAMENETAAQMDEIGQAMLDNQSLSEADTSLVESGTTADDLDFDPYFQEANSSQVQNYEPADSLPQSVKEQIGGGEQALGAEADAGEVNAGEGDALAEPADAAAEQADVPDQAAVKPELNIPEILGEIASNYTEVGETVMAAEPDEDIPAISTSMQSALTFKDSDNLTWPIVGNVLINYSMDKTIYFPTLQQYKYNPAIVIQAAEGEIISAAAAGKVTRVYEDPQIGSAIVMELGNGYELTYGQLANILVSEGSYVAAGDVIAEVGAPTKYYSVEGSNVYFKLTKDGSPVNPMSKLS